MTKLSDAQRVILATAAKRDDLMIVLPPRLRAGQADKALAALAKRHLVVTASRGTTGGGAGIAGVTGYRATAAGLAAIGIEPVSSIGEGLKPGSSGSQAALAPTNSQHAGRRKSVRSPTGARVGAVSASPSTTRGMSADGAGRPARQPPPDVRAPNHAHPNAASPTSRGAVRPGSKLATVIALLARPEGAGIDELAAATAWLQHTVRAALTGLRQRGLAVERRRGSDGRSFYIVTGG